MTEGDKIFKFLQNCNKQRHTPDLHSFKAKIEKGTVWVECRGFEVFIESLTYNDKGLEIRTPWVGNTVAAANRLELLKMDFNTIDM